MKKLVLVVLSALSLAACTSVETATVSSTEVVANGGDAVAVVQGTSIGISAILYMVDIVQSDLDTVVNKLLVTEAKAMGASKVDVKFAATVPRHGIFALSGLILGFPVAHATGIAVK